jgi:hypothetical protein
MSGGIYGDPMPDPIAHASETGRMSRTVGQTNGQAQERPEQWTEKCLEHRTEKCLERNRLEGQNRLEKRLERGFP